MKPIDANALKKFDKKVRWNFKIAVHGYGQNVKQALLDAAYRFGNEIERDYAFSDFLAIQNHETVSIDVDDVEEEE